MVWKNTVRPPEGGSAFAGSTACPSPIRYKTQKTYTKNTRQNFPKHRPGRYILPFGADAEKAQNRKGVGRKVPRPFKKRAANFLRGACFPFVLFLYFPSDPPMGRINVFLRLMMRLPMAFHCSCTAVLLTSSGLDSTRSILSSMMLAMIRDIITEFSPIF